MIYFFLNAILIGGEGIFLMGMLLTFSELNINV